MLVDKMLVDKILFTNTKFQQDLPNQKYEGKWQFGADNHEMIDCCCIPFPPLLSSCVVF